MSVWNRITLAFCLVAGAGSVGGAEEAWTLERAIEVALERSPETLLAQARVAGAEARLQEARSHGLPRLGLQGGYTQTDSPMMAFGSILNQRAFDFGLDFNHPGRTDNLSAAATVGVNLYAGGQVRAGERAAEAGLDAAGYDEEAVRNQLVASTVEAYLNARKAMEVERAALAGVEAYESAVSNAQLRFEAGQLLKADLLSLEVALAEAREQLAQARTFVALSMRAFAFTLGLPAEEAQNELADDDPSLSRIVEPMSLGYENRAELRALEERKRAAEAMVAKERGASRPRVSGFASYQYDKGWETGEAGDSWLAGVSVNFDVFDGGRARARVSQAEAQFAEAREGLRKLRLGLGLEVEQARLTLELARERVAVSALALDQAQESSVLSRARYEEGALLTAELIGVESRLAEARMRHAVAQADERIAIAELRRAVGIFPIRRDET